MGDLTEKMFELQAYHWKSLGDPLIDLRKENSAKGRARWLWRFPELLGKVSETGSNRSKQVSPVDEDDGRVFSKRHGQEFFAAKFKNLSAGKIQKVVLSTFLNGTLMGETTMTVTTRPSPPEYFRSRFSCNTCFKHYIQSFSKFLAQVIIVNF